MRTSGRPSGSTVARCTACGSACPARAAATNQSRKRGRGAAGASEGSKGGRGLSHTVSERRVASNASGTGAAESAVSAMGAIIRPHRPGAAPGCTHACRTRAVRTRRRGAGPCGAVREGVRAGVRSPARWPCGPCGSCGPGGKGKYVGGAVPGVMRRGGVRVGSAVRGRKQKGPCGCGRAGKGRPESAVRAGAVRVGVRARLRGEGRTDRRCGTRPRRGEPTGREGGTQPCGQGPCGTRAPGRGRAAAARDVRRRAVRGAAWPRRATSRASCP